MEVMERKKWHNDKSVGYKGREEAGPATMTSRSIVVNWINYSRRHLQNRKTNKQPNRQVSEGRVKQTVKRR